MQKQRKKLVKKTKRLLAKHKNTTALCLIAVFCAGFIMTASEVRSTQIDRRLTKSQIELRQKLTQIKEQQAARIAASQKTTPTPDSTQTSPPAAPATETKPAEATPPTPQATPAPKPAAQPTPAPAPSTPPPAEPKPISTPGETSSSLAFINSVRAGVGKPALSANATMNGWALSHAQAQAASCGIYHQSLGQFLSVNIGPVTVNGIAENVGYHSTVNGVLEALKNSPGHYGNMIGDYTYAGIGVVTAGSGSCKGYVYTTQLFAR